MKRRLLRRRTCYRLIKKVKDKIRPVECVARGAAQGFMGSILKDPNPLLAPGELHYDSTPAELAKRIQLFRTYLQDGHDPSAAKAVAISWMKTIRGHQSQVNCQLLRVWRRIFKSLSMTSK